MDGNIVEKKPRMLELFSGVGNVARAFREIGWEVVTVDMDQCFGPDVVADVRRWRPGESFDCVWASPPCTTYSMMSNRKYWDKDIPKHMGACEGSACLVAAMDIIEQLNPSYWFIENPRALMRRHMGIPRYTIAQCQYGKPVQKPTDIWSNFEGWEPRPMCKNGSSCHRPGPRGSTTGTQGLPSIGSSIIPYALAREIAEAVDRHWRVNHV